MKRNSSGVVLLSSLTALLLPAAADAQGFYLNVDAGAAFAEKVDLDTFVFRTRDAKIKLDPGVRISAAGGYNFNEFVGVQLETGFIANEVKSISGLRSVDASLAHVPLLADVVVRYDQPDCNWIPFAGAGLGGDVSIIGLDDVRAGGVVVDGAGSDIVFAWQAFAGARYRLNECMSIGGVYKFFSAGGASWDVENVRGDIETGRAQVHSFSVDFNWQF